MTKRLTRWIVFNVVFALLPLLISLFLHHLTDNLSNETLANSTEVLFFTLVVCATALGDLNDVTVPTRWNRTRNILGSSLLIGAVLSAIFFGILVYDNLINPAKMDFRSRLLPYSIGMAVIFGVTSTIVEILLATIQGER